jgi:hypothetical protein
MVDAVPLGPSLAPLSLLLDLLRIECLTVSQLEEAAPLRLGGRIDL